MKECSNCNLDLEDDVSFCPECGGKTDEKTIFCPECGQKTGLDSTFCQHCGKSVKEIIENHILETDNTNAIVETKAPKNKSKKSSRSNSYIITIGLGVLLIIIALFGLKSCGSNSNASTLYIKNNQLNIIKAPNTEPMKLTKSLLTNQTSVITNFSALSENVFVDKNFIIYPTNITGDSATFYLRELKQNAEPKKIDNDVLVNSVTPVDGLKSIIYKKSANGSLYYTTKKDKTLIDKNVVEYHFDSSNSSILYSTVDRNMYEVKLSNPTEKTKLFTDANIVKVEDDNSAVYYTKSDKLYIKKRGEEAKALIGDFIQSSSMLPYIVSENEIYYYKASEIPLVLGDYIIDDLKEADSSINKPVTDDFSKVQNGYFGEYTTTDWNAYYEAQNIYNNKVSRDEFRKDYIENDYAIFEGDADLCFFDGNTSSVIVRNAFDVIPVGSALIASTYNLDGVEKIKFSEITYTSDSFNLVADTVSKASTSLIVYKTLTSPVEDKKYESIETVETIDNGQTVYFIDKVSLGDGKYDRTLTSLSLSDSKISGPNEIAFDVLQYGIYDNSKTIFTVRDGDLYVKDKFIASDVATTVQTSNGNDYILYATDYNQTSGIGTLNLYDGRKSVKISDDVKSFNLTDEGTITYITDYNTKNLLGDLYQYNVASDNSDLLDSDVSCIIQNTNLNKKNNK